MPTYTYGGQALIEGVLMRGRDAVAVALRHPDGDIVFATERLDAGFHGTRWSKWPLIRGLVVLYETLVVGTRWLVRSANVQAQQDGVELGKGSIIVMLTLTLAAGIGIFFLLPLFIASVTVTGTDHNLFQSLVEGLIRVVIFLGYLLLIGRAPDVRRVFQYHGAEHMTIHALEAGDPLTVGEVRKYPTAHQRCGTEFLVIVILLSIIAFSLVGRQAPLVMIASRILLIPVIAAVGYEILKFGARHRGNPVVKVLLYPGLLVQMITTKQPSDDMIEVAIVSMEQALVADGESVPAGSGEFEQRPMALPETSPAAHARPRARSHPSRRRSPPARRHRPIHRPGRERPRHQAGRDRRSIRRAAGRAGTTRDVHRPRGDPPAGPGAVAPRARRRGVPATRGDPRRAGGCPRAARRRRRRRRAAVDGARRDRSARAATRRACSRSSRSSSCRATRTTAAT